MSPREQREIDRQSAMEQSLEAYAVAIRKLSDADLKKEYRERQLAEELRPLLDAETARRAGTGVTL